MLLLFVALTFFLAQAFAIVIDEAVFHRRRGLPLWEKIGHPVDTLSVLICLAWLQLTPPTTTNLITYGVLAVFSSLLVTKDEFVHADRCSKGEHWLHSLLFVLHPMVLGAAAFLRVQAPVGAALTLAGESFLAAAFLLYQVITGLAT